MRRRARSTSGSGTGDADSSACVYGCAGASKSSAVGCGLDDAPEVHHRDAVGDVAHDGEVVGDEQVREPELALGARTSRLRICAWIEPSSAVTGSSSTSSSGSTASARAMPIALALPARQLVRVARLVFGAEPDQREHLGHARARSRRVRPAIRSGSATIARAVMRGSSDEYGSWNTICTRRRIARSARRDRWAMSSPSTRITPAVGSSSRSTRRATVDLPLPDSPTMPERLARAHRERSRRRPRARRRRARREVLHQPVDLEQQRSRRTASPGRHLVGEADTRRGGPLAEQPQLRHGRDGSGPRPAGSGDGTRNPAAAFAGSGGLPGIAASAAAPVAMPRHRRRAAPACTDDRRARTADRPAPSSTTRPAYITTTRSASPATTPRSWVTSTSASPISRCSSSEQLEDLRLRGHVERGGRLVGDQHLRPVRQRHRQHHPLAHAARELVRVRARQLRGRRRGPPARAARRPAARAARRDRAPSCTAIASATWSPTRCTGFSAVIGSWNTIASSRPRSSPVLALRRDPTSERPARRIVAIGDRARAGR